MTKNPSHLRDAAHTPALLPSILAGHGQWKASRTAVVCDGESLNWNQFNRRLNQVANGLREAGLQKGDRVGVVMGNSLEMALVLFGIMKGGFVSVPINISVTDEAISTMLSDSGARALFATPDQASRIDEGLIGCASLAPGARFASGGERAGWVEFEHWRAAQADSEPRVDILPEDSLNIIYSSGTTGMPKGIVHCHQSRLNFARDLALALRYTGQVRTLVNLGLYSNISWVSMLCSMLNGGCFHIQRRFDPLETLRTIEKEGITHCSMVPLQYQRLVSEQKIHGFDLSSLEAPMSVGSALHPDLKQQVIEHLCAGVIELYGLTEGPITICDPEDGADHVGSVGLPIFGSELRLLGDDDRDVPAGEPGEIVGFCRYMMSGYHNREDATAECTWFDEKGRAWIRTGDIGRLDGDGFLYIVGRKKDLILSGGQNVYPEDIEQCIARHEAVAEVAVIGVDSRKWGETPLALVVPQAGTGIDTGELMTWANARLGKQQRIAGVKLLDELPRNANGKILKRELRLQFKDVSYE
jgi:acyl-CoA synthetase (AMP-forming)/AMP-acid ligase II